MRDMRVSRMELYEIVMMVTRMSVQRSPRLYRMCNTAWRSRLQDLSRFGLLKKLQFLINHSNLRMIVKCFNQRLFANDPDILCVLYNEIVQRGLQDTVYVEDIIETYRRLDGKCTMIFTAAYMLACTN
ncbi:hypothetical protein HN011_001994 [Eciton burchellii]|nr:hypothetical protein HN011_001994 [Eciton burchellii]